MAARRARDDWRTYQPLYEQARRRVLETPWYAEGWACDADLWATQCHFGLHKPHWRADGILLESWFGNHEAGNRHTKVALLVPEDMDERGMFVAHFRVRARVAMRELGHYRTDAGPYVVFRKVPVERDTLVPRLLAELEAVHVLGDSVDGALVVIRGADAT